MVNKHGTELRLLGVHKDNEGNIQINAATPSGLTRHIPLDTEEALILISRLAKMLAGKERGKT